ncbi:MAG: carboxypeptidase-like regulatory domain-containing protein, partial [Methanosarcinaceae archaeon]|nr:carboxypeptidase-like regulatory domain-containing protein [Methanosarcinaceae archaeon]
MDKEYLVKFGVRAGILLIITLFAISFVTGVGNAGIHNEDTVFNKTDCQVTLPYGFTDNGNGRAIWTYGEMTSGQGDLAKVHRLYCYYDGQNTGGKARCELHLFELPEERVKEYFTRGKSAECRSVTPDWMGGWSRILESTDDRFVMLCGRPGPTPDDPDFHEIVGNIYYRKAMINICVESQGSEDIVMSVFDALEKNAKAVIDGKEFSPIEVSDNALDIFVQTNQEIYSRGDRATISGYVHANEGMPVENAEVSILVLNPVNKSYTATTTTNGDGYYEVSNSFGETAIKGEWMIVIIATKDGYREDSAWWIMYCESKTGGIHSERMRLQDDYPNLTKGHILFSEGMVTKPIPRLISGSISKKPDYGHVGIYIGDFEANKSYTVLDKAQLPLKVFRNGEAISLTKVGDTIEPGDWIIGCVVEARGKGIVFNTVDGMLDEARRTMGKVWDDPEFAWKTTNPPPDKDDVDKIVKFSLEKIDLTQQGKAKYMFGQEGSELGGIEWWDCVSLGIAAYEEAGIFPTPLRLDDWVSVQPQELYDFMGKPAPRSIQKAFNIIVESPVNLHLYDSQNRHVGFTPSGAFERDIPNAYYYLEVEQDPQAIFVQNADEEYTLVIQAVDSGSFNLKIQDLNVSRSDSLTKVEFLDVSITESTIATIPLGADHKDYHMSIDQDGDG